MNERVYSSKFTWFMKVVVPGLWTAGFAATLVSFWSCGKLPDGSALELAGVAAFWLAVSAYVFWYCRRLKAARQVGDTLFVSDFSREIAVPVSQVSRATENRWDKNRLITIYFKVPTEFGDKVVFIPQMSWTSSPFKDHPVLTDLRTTLRLPS